MQSAAGAGGEGGCQQMTSTNALLITAKTDVPVAVRHKKKLGSLQ